MKKRSGNSGARDGDEIGRGTVKPEVISAIEAEAIRNHAPAGNLALLRAGRESLELEADLNIRAIRRATLAIPYNRISESHGGIRIGVGSSRGATTVQLAVNLVYRRSNRHW